MKLLTPLRVSVGDRFSDEGSAILIRARATLLALVVAACAENPASVVGSSETIGPSGGSLVASAGAVRLEVPPGALAVPTELSVTQAADVPVGSLGRAFALGPNGTTFAKPVTLFMKYDPALVPPDWNASSLTVTMASENGWVDVPTSVDETTNILVASINHFSTYSYKVANPSVVTTPDGTAWTANGSCWASNDATYNGLLAQLSRGLFKLASPPSTGTGCVTEPYLTDGYSFYWPTLENHAGIDFRAQTPLPVYAIVDGVVELELLDQTVGTSTLTVKSVVAGNVYHVMYLHCQSHEQIRNGVSLGQLNASSTIRAGDQVCMSGSVGASAAHLHFEVKAAGMDADNLRALSGSHCPTLFFYGYDDLNKTFDKYTQPGCPLAYIRSNTVDPVVLLGKRVAIDGVLSPGEWTGASAFTFNADLPGGGTTPATLLVMNDDKNLYLAVKFARNVLDPGTDLLNFEFDNNNNSVGPESGDDYITYSVQPFPGFADAFRVCSGGTLCGVSDDRPDGAGAFQNTGGFGVYEMSHPLNSGDAGHDFALTRGQTVGLALRLLIDGVTTHFPGAFPSYLPITIGPSNTPLR